MTTTAWILSVGAVYRLTLLVVADTISAPPRDWLLRRLGPDHKVSYLITCPWCASIHVAPWVVASGLLWSNGWGWQLAAGSLAASALTGLLAHAASPD